MKKYFVILMGLLFLAFPVYATDVDTKDGSAITTTSDMDGSSDSHDIADGQTIKSAGTACSITDTFTGANDSDPPGWTEENGTWDIQGNTYRAGNASFTRNDTALSGANQFAKFKIADIGTGTGTMCFILRSSSDGTGDRYIVGVEVDGDVFWKRYNATTWQEQVEIDSGALSPVDGEWFGAELIGTGNDTVVKYWEWASDPGDYGATNWGTADGTMEDNPSTAVDSGNYVGLHNNNEFQKYDDFCAGVVP